MIDVDIQEWIYMEDFRKVHLCCISININKILVWTCGYDNKMEQIQTEEKTDILSSSQLKQYLSVINNSKLRPLNLEALLYKNGKKEILIILKIGIQQHQLINSLENLRIMGTSPTHSATPSSHQQKQKQFYNVDWFKKLKFLKELGACKSLMRDSQSEKQYMVITNTYATEHQANKFITQLASKYLSHLPHQEVTEFLNYNNDQENKKKREKNLQCNAHQFHVNPLALFTFTMSNICSKHQQVIQIYDYEDCSYTLYEEIVSRSADGNQTKRKFNEKEIWSIICSCVLPMAHFTRNQIYHGTLTPKDIVLSSDGRIRIVGSQISEYNNWIPQHQSDMTLQNIQTLYNLQPQKQELKKMPFFYYSPQTLKSLNSIKKSQISNYSSWNKSNPNNKEAVFTLGLTVLSVILCEEDLSFLYKITHDTQTGQYKSIEFDAKKLQDLIRKIDQQNSFGVKESKEGLQMERVIVDILRKMLKIAPYERICFTELEEMLYDILQKNEQYFQWDQNQYKKPCGFKGIMVSQQDEQNCYERNEYKKLEQSILRKNRQKVSPVFTNNNPYLSVDKEDEAQSQKQEYKQLMLYMNGVQYRDVQIMDEQKQHDYIGNAPNSQISSYTAPLADSKNANKQKQIRTLSSKNEIHNKQNIGKEDPYVHKKQKSGFSFSVQINQQSQLNTFRESICSSNHLDNQKVNHHRYYVTEQYSRGRYQGYKEHHMRNGFGTLYYQEGGKYSGQWMDNKMQGRGALYYSNGELAYEGEWMQDMLQGYGVLYNQSPVYITSSIDYQQLDKVNSCWVKYEGYFQEDRRQGQGTLYFSNGQVFRGYFSADLPNGPGIYKDANGKHIQGIWCKGIMKNQEIGKTDSQLKTSSNTSMPIGISRQ